MGPQKQRIITDFIKQNEYTCLLSSSDDLKLGFLHKSFDISYTDKSRLEISRGLFGNDCIGFNGSTPFEIKTQFYKGLHNSNQETVQKIDKWSEIGGLDVEKRIITETLELSINHSEIFSKSPIRLQTGVLIYGYPGTGKTHLSLALSKFSPNMISLTATEILTKYIGESEKKIRDLLTS